jgi:hypothetical protein
VSAATELPTTLVGYGERWITAWGVPVAARLARLAQSRANASGRRILDEMAAVDAEHRAHLEGAPT